MNLSRSSPLDLYHTMGVVGLAEAWIVLHEVLSKENFVHTCDSARSEQFQISE